jgi:DNA (cytosine-5)-methyltransferase 1
MSKIKVIDLFCGFGGTTTGIENARINGHKIAEVIACVNHDPKAIESHEANHPSALHYIEDIRVLDLSDLKAKVQHIRATEPDTKICLWASLECTNFSRAKGGQPRDADSRTLAEHLYRYIEALNPDMLWIENVVEFMSWGPLCENGKPISKRSGSDFIRWCNHIQSYGYSMEWREINTADLGGHTSRNRLFGQFVKQGLSIVWPEASHAKNPHKGGMFTNLQKWKPVREVLDLDIVGNSIFDRKKPLSDKTHERIYHGLVKFVGGGKKQHEAFMLKYMSTRTDGSMVNCTQSVDGPCPTLTVSHQPMVVSTQFVDNYYGNGYTTGLDEPITTLRTKDAKSLITPFIYRDFSNSGFAQSIDKPGGSLTAVSKMSIVQPEGAAWIQNRQFNPETHNHTIEEPAPTLLAKKEKELVVAEPWLSNFQFNNNGNGVDSPAPTLVSSRRYYYLLNPQWGVEGKGDIEKPCFTLIARMDKAPPHLVEVEQGQIGILVNDTDDKYMRLIKEFMAAYGIVDIKMRMLTIEEKLRIQGFPDTYKMVGNQADKNKFIGNSVTPIIPQRMAEVFYLTNLAA